MTIDTYLKFENGLLPDRYRGSAEGGQSVIDSVLVPFVLPKMYHTLNYYYYYYLKQGLRQTISKINC